MVEKQTLCIVSTSVCSFFLEGRRHDAGMLADSRFLNDLQTFANSPLGNPYCIYCDPAYPLRVRLQAPFRNGVLTPPMMEFNRSMSTVYRINRVAIQ